MTNSNTLLVGGGITSSLIGFCLRNHKHVVIDLWEKENELGGRMRTFRSQHAQVAVDVGAQYITSTDALLRQNEDVYNTLLENSKITPMICRIDGLRALPSCSRHYVAPAGMCSIVEHFIDVAQFRNIRTSYSVTSLNILTNVIEVETNTGTKERYKAVVLTMPVPAVLELCGNFKDAISEGVHEELKKVKYSSRFVLILIYNELLKVEWAAKYLPDDELLRYVAIQEKKVNIDGSESSSVIFHSSVEFAERCHDLEGARLALMDRVRERFPQWRDPADVICYRWPYSQVVRPFRDTPKHIVLHSKPLIILAGDGFSVSNFDGCVDSAKSAVDTLLRLF